ncbi:MAG: hypothetical protein ACP5HT_02100 [Conexivisphaera sp.]
MRVGGQRPKGNTRPSAARMEGVPHDAAWWDAIVLPALVGGYVLTGVERRVPDEPVRGLYDAVKPKLYVAYDRYEDAYLPMRT